MNGSDCGRIRLVMGGFYGIASPENWHVSHKINISIELNSL